MQDIQYFFLTSIDISYQVLLEIYDLHVFQHTIFNLFKSLFCFVIKPIYKSRVGG